MTLINRLQNLVGTNNVLTDEDAVPFGHDWTGKYVSTPLCVVKPADTAEISEVVRLCSESCTPIVPVSGNTGLAGGAQGEGAVMISMSRLNTIREIRPEARVAIVEAGVVLSALHEAVDDHDLVFPLTFGARGSAMIGGCLSTNAGGSNVVRYGSTRGLCMGIEAVLPDGRVLDLMSELHKDNSGYDLRDLLIGAEGTLGLITAAVVKLVPKPKAYGTAMLAARSLPDGLTILNRLQSATGGAVEAFEFMPRAYIERHMAHIPNARAPFDDMHDVNIMVEIAATAARDADPDETGTVPLIGYLETILSEFFDSGELVDAVVAKSEGQRREMWARREAAAEVTLTTPNIVDNDVCVPVDKVATFLDQMTQEISRLNRGAEELVVSHLGDGNIHYTVFPTKDDVALRDEIRARVDAVVSALGGSFSAEHGIGLTKLPSMRRLKDPVALDMMRAIKSAIDPKDIMNPGKVVPSA